MHQDVTPIRLLTSFKFESLQYLRFDYLLRGYQNYDSWMEYGKEKCRKFYHKQHNYGIEKAVSLLGGKDFKYKHVFL